MPFTAVHCHRSGKQEEESACLLMLAIVLQILGFWMFGSTVCKLHAVLENFGKILSALILAAMSFDRY